MTTLGAVAGLILVGLVGCEGGGGAIDARRRRDDATPPIDAGVHACLVQPRSSCNVLTQTGCDLGQKCSWIRIEAGPGGARGLFACVGAGPRGEGASCQWGPAGLHTGHDDCARGLLCLADPEVERAAGVCGRLCDLAEVEPAARCPGAHACVSSRDGWPSCVGDPAAVAGVCAPTCDPLTQQRRDGAGACVVASGAPAGCYGLPSRDHTPSDLSCHEAGPSVRRHGWQLDRGARVNACAPGFVPALPATDGSGAVACTALCRPVDTHAGAPGGAGGAAPHACADRGAPGAECRFWWWFEAATTRRSGPSDELGLCVDPARQRWDRDGDGVAEAAWPRCADLPISAPDPLDTAAAWGCRPSTRSAD